MNIIQFPVERTRQTPDSLIRKLDQLLLENRRIEAELAKELEWTRVAWDELQGMKL